MITDTIILQISVMFTDKVYVSDYFAVFTNHHFKFWIFHSADKKWDYYDRWTNDSFIFGYDIYGELRWNSTVVTKVYVNSNLFHNPEKDNLSIDGAVKEVISFSILNDNY